MRETDSGPDVERPRGSAWGPVHEHAKPEEDGSMKTGKVRIGSAWIGGLAVVLALVPLVPEVVLGQSSAGSIRGSVVDENGQPIENANVVATQTETNFQRGMLTEETGFYNLSGLPPGPYEITVSHPSFATRTRKVRVQTGQTLSMDVNLTVEAIEVAGIRAVLETERHIESTTPEVATNITQAQIENLPQLNRDFLDFATLVPGVRRTANGNSIEAGGLPAENINLFIDGASYKSDILQEGIVGQDASPGNPFPQNAVQEFRVITQNYKAEFQKATSAVITATTKSGTNEWEGSAFFLGQNESMIGKTVFDECEAPVQGPDCTEQDVDDIGRRQFGGAIGGPIIEDKLFVFGSYEGNYRNIPQNINTISAEDLARIPQSIAGVPVRQQIAEASGTSPVQDLEANLYFAKLTYQPGERHRFETSVNVRDEFELRDFGGPNALSQGTEFLIDVYTVVGRYDYSRDRLLNEALVNWQKFEWNPIPFDSDTPNLIFQGVLNIGGRCCGQDQVQERLEFRDDVTYALPDWGGEHVFKGGGYVNLSDYEVTQFNFANPRFVFRQTENFEFPFEARLAVGEPTYLADNTQYGLYLQDDWSPTPRLILNLGLRWDVETNMFNNDWVTPDSVIQDVAPLLTPAERERYFTDGDDRDPFYGAVAPRLGFTYDLTGDQTTTLFGGWGLFYDRTRFGLAAQETKALQFPQFVFNFSEDGQPNPAGRPTIVWEDRFLSREGLLGILAEGNPAVKPEAKLVANDLEPPKANQWTIGVRQALGPIMASANYTGVRGENIFTFFPVRDADNRVVQTDRFRGVFLATDAGETWYDALMLQVGKPFTVASRWGAQLSYTLAESEVNIAGDFTFNAPEPAALTRFPSNSDIRHEVTVNWTLGLPWDTRFSGIGRYQSALPLSAQIFGDPDGDGFGPDFPEGETRNSRRRDDSFTEVNVRFDKGFTFATGQRIAVQAEIFNLFDNENFGCPSDVFGVFNQGTGELETRDNFGNLNCVVGENPSRRLQLGVRYGM